LIFGIGCSAAPSNSGVFNSKLFPDTKIRYVRNSGVCETTPGVGQVSGYIDVGTNMSMWFWFFEARQNADQAPFTLWLNGGPGCSSMIGLFQEHGPCKVNEASNDTTLNPYSWNSVSNMIYIDQPIGTGFSYGSDPVNSTFTAAPWIWKAFQILFESQLFSKYESREFILSTESYGGHYGPEFVTYFDQQNTAISSGKVKGEKIVTSALVINNGWYDPLLQNEAYVYFAIDAPGYGPLVNETIAKQLLTSFYGKGGCKEQEEACYALGQADTSQSDTVCKNADDFCGENIFAVAVGNRDPDDLRAPSNDSFPSESYVNFLNNKAIQKKIGATSTYAECPDAPYEQFVKTGDDARSLLPQLQALVESGLKTLIWAGDADINCNWLGGHASMLAMNWTGKAELARTPMTNITVSGKTAAAVQNVKNFSFARVYAAGHEIPAYQPEAALAIFKQVIAGQQIHSV